MKRCHASLLQPHFQNEAKALMGNVRESEIQRQICGSRDGALVRVLASHQCFQGSIPAWCHMWVEFVLVLALGWCGFRSKYCNLFFIPDAFQFYFFWTSAQYT